MIITVENIMAASPCREYSHKQVEDLVGDGLEPREIAALNIPAEDRLWVLSYVVLDDRRRRLLACDCAERALSRERAAGREPDERSWTAIDVARRYARGEATHAELDAAGDDALDAARAAWAAALDAALDAEDAAGAAWDAACAAAWGAARDAAWGAEREWQLERALEYAEGVLP